jgi:alpha-glucosidase
VLGTRRARAAALLTMALPGSVYLYQGEELSLWEVEDIPDERRQDPIWYRTGGADPGRDGCRVPLPWAGLEPPFGFSPPAGAAGPANTAATGQPWLPQPKEWRELTVELQAGDPDSMLELYRAAPRCASAVPSPPSATEPSAGCRPPPTSSPSPEATRPASAATCPASPTSRPPRSPCLPIPPCSWPAVPQHRLDREA